jgi:hypothetical protein
VQLVEGYRDEQGRVRQRVVATLGRREKLKASGELDRLAAAFTRLDPPPEGTRVRCGTLALVASYLKRLGLAAAVDRALPARGRAQLTHGEVICALVANRLCDPRPLYDVRGWADEQGAHPLLGTPAALLNDDRLGRALDALARVIDEVKGALSGRVVRSPHQADRCRRRSGERACAGARPRACPRTRDRYTGHSRRQAEVLVDTVTHIVLAQAGLDVGGETVPYIAGWGEDGALEAIRAYAHTVDDVARRIEEAVLA